MSSLHSHSFFWQWQTLYASSNPGHLKDRWKIDGVDWSRERHIYWSDQYSMHLEVHRLERKSGDKLEWQLLVVIERWWGSDRQKSIRDSSWCKLIQGRADRVLAWLQKQDVQRAPPAAGTVDKANP